MKTIVIRVQIIVRALKERKSGLELFNRGNLFANAHND
jgi:hypothetical protein